MRIFRFLIPIIGISIGATLYHGVTMLQEPNPIQSFQRNVSKFEVTPGDVITITSDVVRTKDGCESTIRRSWLDSNGNIFHENEVERQAIPAGKENFFVGLTIPPTVSQGTLRLHTQVEFYCNFMQRVTHVGSVLNLPDIYFRVHKTLHK